MMLEIRDVKKSFGGLTVLDGISLDVEKGDGGYSRTERVGQNHLPAVPELSGDRGQRKPGV